MTGSVVRVLALWSPDWPVTAAAHAARVPPHQPAAVFVAGRVLACSAVARAQGVRRGLRRREAQARYPRPGRAHPRSGSRRPGVRARGRRGRGAGAGGGDPPTRPGGTARPRPGGLVRRGAGGGGAPGRPGRRPHRRGGARPGLADGLFAAVLAARRAVAVAPGRHARLPRRARRRGARPRARHRPFRPRRPPPPPRAAQPGRVRRARPGGRRVPVRGRRRALPPARPRARPPAAAAAAAAGGAHRRGRARPAVDRVDAAAFAARGLAERLHATLAGHGLACTRLGVTAHTAAGEELHRIWRCAEPLTPAATVDRVRWQLDAWLTNRRDHPDATGAVIPPAAGARRRPSRPGRCSAGCGARTGEADERAGRALVRVQALLGPESVVTAVRGGGRDPAERVRLVPWGDERGEPAAVAPAADARHPAAPVAPLRPSAADPARQSRPGGPGSGPRRRRPGRLAGRRAAPHRAALGGGAAAAGWPSPGPRSRRRRLPAHRSPRPSSVPESPPSWPGRLPAPSPATVPPAPLPALVHDAADEAVRLDRPDLLTAPPAWVAVDGRAPAAVVGWSGPWPVWARWWSPEATPSARMQVVLDDGTALLLVAREGRWWVDGVYD